MPLVRIDIVDHRTPEQIRAIADAVHRAVVDVLGIPERDRFQIVTTHRPGEIVALDAGLGFDRSPDVVMIHIFTQAGRSDTTKRDLFARIAERLAGVGVDGRDVFVGITENGAQDWSFGFGKAQYLTGELAVPSSAS
ncbi:probable 4-oxalocrotonate tautomerase [Mycolicibacterium canariasense]|uniref:Probable 4-oxalocrotonate tautomerase n=1 Tax=Mycolicibacterium canariasense TaxID=228230 RepID=A0A100WDK1_MYCCR|nr:tautomerase family protein [Mycolicibacterium canariasense]MCV7210511.1 tautomerase family protein [Mycolicibacterium canariasense]ORU97003.1 tautomerase [Mycolicibacterium canariasense]GAS95948.1 probable 4-oxalocrotonate tautomerase [Mycolicibacterium canariasense]